MRPEGFMSVDRRIYVTASNLAVHLKTDGPSLNCHRMAEGEDSYHRILSGEIYVSDGRADYCLTCAVVLGLATPERPALGKSARQSLHS
jgi:hypothetical protein